MFWQEEGMKFYKNNFKEEIFQNVEHSLTGNLKLWIDKNKEYLDKNHALSQKSLL